MVVANDSYGNPLWLSNIDSGYSVDNLPPGAVPVVTAQAVSQTTIQVHWPKDVVDPDVGYYQVYRSTTSNFTPNPGNSLGIATDTNYTDNTAVTGFANYYRVVTVDIHGNRSSPSPQAVAGIQSTEQVSLQNGWNLISVPMVVDNFTASVLYPTATSHAFGYIGTYVSSSILANGYGYWLSFSGNQTVPITGYPFQAITVPVQAGWNLIGSISAPLPVSSIQSTPPGLVTSPFFGYQAGYSAATTLQPGRGYWVKVNTSGALILNPTASNAADRIHIVPTSEQPPPPPGEVILTNGSMPAEYALNQSYPNPFNPTTTIGYQLPATSRVTLRVYNLLGQVVSTLKDEVEDAGYKTATWDASRLTSGVYYYRIEAASLDDPANTFVDIKRMTLVK